jgi:ABC-type transport system involved in cytochrome c biogenesis permease subunit
MALLDLQYMLGNLSFACLLAMVVWYWLKLTFSLNPSLAPVGTFGMATANLSLAGLLLARWFTSGHFPLSNLYESLLFLSWGFTAFHLIMEVTSRSDFFGIVTSPVALLTDAFASFSLPKEMQKTTALVPALQSNWLMMHVTVMMISYVALISGSLLALAFLVVNYYDRKALKNALSSSLECEEGNIRSSIEKEDRQALSPTRLQPQLVMLERGACFVNQGGEAPMEGQGGSVAVAEKTRTNFTRPVIGTSSQSLPSSELPQGSLDRTRSIDEVGHRVAFDQASQAPQGLTRPHRPHGGRGPGPSPFHPTGSAFHASLRDASTVQRFAERALSQAHFTERATIDLPFSSLSGNPRSVASAPFSPFAQTLDNLSYRTLGLGFPLLTIGILSGAVWANEAWGSYWSWDPKETWALITWLVFAIYLHTRLSKGWRGNKPALIAVAGFFVVWICYLGVNLLGTGLHSYGWFQARG